MSIRNYLSVARFDHWFKNAFMIPGVVLALFDSPQPFTTGLLLRITFGFVVAGIVASGNYIFNDILDAPQDSHHPLKKDRPLAAGTARKSAAWAMWCASSLTGLSLALLLGTNFFLCAAALWVQGICYNAQPLRLKDKPYLDVLSESVNNPIRLGLGWFATGNPFLPTLSLVLAYWMIGAFFMAVKRLAEYRCAEDRDSLARYRSSFRVYTEESLMGAIVFTASAFAMFFGIFLIRYRIELVLSVPFIAAFMGAYLYLGFLPDSPAQYPEKLYRQKGFVAYTALCCLVLLLLLFVDIPYVEALFAPLHLPG